ncbi:hypothetical protein GBQ70_08000 [Halomicrobium sp. ZPS1]|uniref:Uncharacterized protein n=1 Tax=Halomicrobium mukohataei TaxID=57705 RepID=A0A4D6KE31_9EURY|nr:hypothetical protein E5139_08005 [Halomicrobium mukohataei]QFR20388.1 hypothetical protein GBQ70_08000 [Halomicrobium sp. ZPS1]
MARTYTWRRATTSSSPVPTTASTGSAPSSTDTAGCNCFKVFATRGSRNSIQTYSRQYDTERAVSR